MKSILLLSVSAVMSMVFSSCQVDQELKVKIETVGITEVGYNYGIITGSVIDIGSGTIEQHGFCYSTNEEPTIFDLNTQLGTKLSVGEFTDSITGLQGGTKYYVKAYAQAKDEIFYGSQASFTTLSPGVPVVIIETVGQVSGDSVELSCKVTDDGGSAVSARGVAWSLQQNPSVEGPHTTNGTGEGSYDVLITGLMADTVYYIRAYATSIVTTSYSEQQQVTTPQGAVLITTKQVTGITMTGAITGGDISDDGGAPVTARGVCWNLSGNPTQADQYTSDGTGTGSYNSTISGLASGTTYYVRAYATSSIGTFYGQERSFTTTSQSASIPQLSTTTVTGITQTGATGGGNVIDDGGSSVTARGICWSTAHDPDLGDSFTIEGTGMGSFSSQMTGLDPNTTYYVRAYATNGNGTAYGGEVSFTTSQSLYVPTLTTTTVSSITETSAVSGGNISDDGGSSVTAKGVCWSTASGPDLTDDHTSDGTGSGSYTSNISGLSSNTTYYVRAYATNSEGTAYGNEVSFTTQSAPALPTLTTAAVTNIATNGARSGGNITSNGGSTVVARGVCWSTSHNPVRTGDHTTDGGGTGSFTSNMTGLNANTTYYVRAYATNSAGTAYGNEVSFTTLAMGASVTDFDNNVYPTVDIGTQTWMAENLKVTHYNNGDPIPQLANVLDWVGATAGGYCYYNNEIVQYGEIYGALYNFLTIDDTRGVCPAGWHVPTDTEWTTLEEYVGGASVAAAKLKEEGTEHWSSSNYSTNEYGFTALPGGSRNYHDGNFSSVRNYGDFWSSTASSSSMAYARQMAAGNYATFGGIFDKKVGFSIRCIKD